MHRSLRCLLFSLLFVSALLHPSPVEAGIYDADADVTYKEYWVSHSEFTGGCGSHEVPEGGSWYLEPWPCTKNLTFEIPDDFSQALKVEIYLDLWRNHAAQSARFSLNGGPTHAPDVGYDWSRTPYIAEIPKSELQQGTNTITLWNAAGGYHVHDIGFRIHYDDAHPLLPGSGSDVTPPDGQLTSIVASNGAFLPAAGGTLAVDDDQVTLNATASGGDVKFVEFHAYYYGYDEDNDGEFLDWHNLGRNNFHPGGVYPQPRGGTIDHIGTDSGAPYAATWDLPHIQNQSGVRFKIRVVDNAGNVREAAGGVSAGFVLSRTDTVETYVIPGFRDAVLHHGGTYPDIITRFIDLPDDLSDLSEAYIIGAYWENPYIEINDNPQFKAFNSDEDVWKLSIKEIPVPYLQPGENRIDYVYNPAQVSFGQFIEEPGPMLVLRQPPLSPPPDESPPFTNGHDPAPGATNVDPASNVSVHVADIGTGVATTTLTMTVEGTPVTPTITGDPSDYVLVYDPPVDFSPDEVVTVTVDACDLHVPPNCMDTEVYSFTVGMASPPVIDVWYGSTQGFGHIGTPQQWVNILGNVSDPDGVASLVYSLNGGPESALSIGADTRRLASEGDFNVDLLCADLVSGTNRVVITATDGFSRQSVETVTVEYASGSVWPNPHSIDWDTATSVQDAAQVVDGKWTVESDGARPVEIGYDRLVAIGDLSWTDYEVRVPITIHDVDMGTGSVSGGPGLGILMRWTGHTDSPISGWQPKSGWEPYGAIGWWRWTSSSAATLQFHETGISQSFLPTLGVRYVLRMSVQSTSGQGGLYRLKVWEDSQPEPPAWNLTYQAGPSDLSQGSFMLLAHHVDASFGDVTVVPVDSVTTTLTVSTVGNGTVAVEPDQPEYTYGQVVTLTATPEAGWTFSDWRGDWVGSDNPAIVTMTEDKAVTAVFIRDEYTLQVNTIGNGTVITEPVNSTYHYGDVVTFTAAADVGWTFAGWSGDLTGTDVTATKTITGDTAVTATFVQDECVVAVNTVGSGTVITEPVKPTYRYGDVVSFTATADVGWTFAGWSGDLSSTDNPETIAITGDTAVTATFTLDAYTLTVNRVGNGQVDRDPDQATYRYGDVVTLTATATPTWTFAGWSGDLTGIDNPEAIAITGNASVTGTFTTTEEYTLTINIIGSGSVTVDPSQTTYHYGDVVTLTAMADPGWAFAGWSGDLTGTESTAPRTITGNATITATFRHELFLPFVVSTQLGDRISSGSRADPGGVYRSGYLMTHGAEAGFGDRDVVLVRAGRGSSRRFLGAASPLDPEDPRHGGDSAVGTSSTAVDEAQGIVARMDSEGRVIDVWYGHDQRFGHIGNPQNYVNVLGNVSDPDGVDSLVYSLNGGPESALSVGPDTRRLASAGDFNIDLLYTDLVDGMNQVVITATDNLAQRSVETVTVDYVSGNVWPDPYIIDWSADTDIQDVAQVVDGKWAVEADSVRPVEIGYDRLVAIGDLSWTDYEVTVPITIHEVDMSTGPVSGDPGLGLLMRWTGHTDSPISGWQPKSGWVPYGAIGWWRWSSLTSATLQFHQTEVSQSFLPALGVRYIFKMSVESTPGQGGLYRLKVWEDGQPEPSAWNLTYQAESSSLSHGSFMLLAHYVDASFGDVTVVPVGYTTSLTVTTVGSGTVAVEPDQPEYAYGQVVTLTAIPEAGWTFSDWSGDLVGSENPAVLTMTEDKGVTATFTQDEYALTVNTAGSGSVDKDPDQAIYYYGDVVTLTAMADPGWTFAGWSGDLTGTDITATKTITGNAAVTATFMLDEYALTVNTAGSGSVDKDPDQAIYYYGDVVTLTVTADPGWTFAGWSGDLSGSANPATITMTGDADVTATFTEDEYTLMVNVVGNGRVTVDPDQVTYHYGDVVTLTAIADPEWTFIGWSGDLRSTDNPHTITVTGNTTTTATFAYCQIFLPLVTAQYPP